jgi:hypothetical protein
MLYGEVDHPTYGFIHTFCTHLTADLPLVNVAKENLDQSKEILEFVNYRIQNRTGEVVLMLGDFNTVSKDLLEIPLESGEYYD